MLVGHKLDWSSWSPAALGLSQTLAGAHSLRGDRRVSMCVKPATLVQGQPVREPILILLSVNRLHECIRSHTHVLYRYPQTRSLPSSCYDHALVEGIFLHNSSLKTQHAPYFCFTAAVFRLRGLGIVSWVVMKVTSPPPTISTWCHKRISRGQLVKRFGT